MMFNETVNLAKTFTNNSWNYLSTDFFNRVLEIFGAPFKHEEMIWMLVPLLASIVFMEVYFGRYKHEELGWNTAYGNALVLIFIAIDLFRRTYEPLGLSIKEGILSGNTKIVIALVILAFALILLFIDFFHFLPKKVAYAISSPAYINSIALLGVIIVYSKTIALDWTTLFACIVILGLFTLIAQIFYYVIPSYKPPLQRIITANDLENLRKSKKLK